MAKNLVAHVQGQKLMIKLVDYDTGKPTYIDVGAILSIRPLKAQEFLTERTRIDTVSDQLLVRETSEEVAAEIRLAMAVAAQPLKE